MLDVMTTTVALTQKLNCVILIRSFEHILVQWFLNFSIEVLWKTFLIKKWGGKRILQELDLKTYSNDSILIYALNFNSIKIHTTSIFNFLYAIAVIVSQNARLFSNNNRCAKTTTKINWKRCAIVCVVAVAVTPLSLYLCLTAYSDTTTAENLKYNSCLVARPFHSTTMLEFTLFNYSVARGINIQSRPALSSAITLCVCEFTEFLDVQWLDVNVCCERKKVPNRHDRSEMICIQ